MKKFILSALLPAFLLVCQGCSNDKKSSDSFSKLKASFKTPPHQFASAPLWVWNDDVNEEKISFMLKDFRNKGFGGVFIHPRPGLITPYQSQRWFDLCAFTLQEAIKDSLDVWIYDENSYPSGFAGGHVPDVMPESYNQGQMLELVKTSSLPETSNEYYLALKKNGDSFADITSSWNTEKGKPGDFYLFRKTFYGKSGWYGGFTYVDLMAKGVTEKFIEQTMPGYEKVFGAEFGKAVPGLFSDEPNIEVQRANSIRWTPDLFETFKNRWGYALETSLPSLFEETGDWKKVRHNYFETLNQLFIDRWSKPFSSYLQKHNLEWTGHYWEHEWPNPNTVPDNMAMYAWHQRPAIDMLFNQFDEKSPHAQFGNIRSVKELASVANQLNKKRTLSETYGGAGWEITYKDLKRLGDWEFVLGVNTLNQHLAHMTLMGARKYDYPQSFSYQNPWWPYYKSLNDYFTRLSLALSSGKQQNRILIIEPTTTAWQYFSYDHSNDHFTELGEQFQKFVTVLEKLHVEYDLGSENIIQDHGSVVDSRFLVGSAAYETVILPATLENLDDNTFKLLDHFAEAGGKLGMFGKIETIDGKQDPRTKEFNERNFDGKFTGVPFQTLVSKHLQSPELKISTQEGNGGNLYHMRRTLSDGDLLFLSNVSLEQTSTGNITIQGADVLAMDLFTGEIYHYPNQAAKGQTVFNFSIPATGSLLLFVPKETQTGYPEYPATPMTRLVDTAPAKVSRIGDNTLAIDFCDLKLEKASLKEVHVYYATDTLFKSNGFVNGNPWNTSVQFRDQTIARDTFKTGRFTAGYHFNVAGQVDKNSLKAVIERAGLFEISINGQSLKPTPGQWWLDKEFSVVEIGKWVRNGDNLIVLSRDRMSIHAELEPVYITGDFALASANHGWTIVAPSKLQIGSWRDQGMPMFGDKVSYKKKFVIRENVGHHAIQLGSWKGTVSAVRVNGKEVGNIAYPPYQLEISSALRPGENEVEVVVVGSLKNLLGPHHNKPAPGLVSPWHFRNIRKYPAGKEYDVADYGLLEDFQIVEW